MTMSWLIGICGDNIKKTINNFFNLEKKKKKINKLKKKSKFLFFIIDLNKKIYLKNI
jgi:hypothetical protein